MYKVSLENTFETCRILKKKENTFETCRILQKKENTFETCRILIRTYCLEARIYNLHKKILVPQRIHTGNTSVLFTEAIFIYIGRCKCLFITKRKGNIHWNVRDLHRKICVPQRIHTGNTSVLFTEEIFITSAYPHSESTCARSSCKARLPGNY